LGASLSNTREQIRGDGNIQEPIRVLPAQGQRTYAPEVDDLAKTTLSPDHTIQCFTEKTPMTKFNILGAAAVLSLMSATPVFAQAAIQEPGAFAFAYPNNDVLNGGRPTPAATQGGGPYASIDPQQAARADVKMPVVFGSNPYADMADAGSAACAQRYRSYDAASGTFVGRDGRRHECR
jgi:hypothetical protein